MFHQVELAPGDGARFFVKMEVALLIHNLRNTQIHEK